MFTSIKRALLLGCAALVSAQGSPCNTPIQTNCGMFNDIENWEANALVGYVDAPAVCPVAVTEYDAGNPTYVIPFGATITFPPALELANWTRAFVELQNCQYFATVHSDNDPFTINGEAQIIGDYHPGACGFGVPSNQRFDRAWVRIGPFQGSPAQSQGDAFLPYRLKQSGQINGPNVIAAGEAGNYTVDVNGLTPPISYAWWVDGIRTQTATQSFLFQGDIGAHELIAQAYDAGNGRTSTLNVTVSGGGGCIEC